MRGGELLAGRCQALRAAYESGDRRPDMLSMLADCYLIEADVWRANALHDDADRRRATPDELTAPDDAVDLGLLARQWDEACREFEQSLALEPSVGAQLGVALCRIRRGKLADSRQLLDGMVPQMSALAASKDPFHVNRLALVNALLSDIDRVQPRVTLRVAAAGGDASAAVARADDLVLAIDGKPVPAQLAQPLDAGRYQVSARDGAAAAETTLVLGPRARSQLTLEVTPPTSSRRWHMAAGALAGVSVAAAVGGGVAWWRAEDLLSDLEAAGGTERPEGFDCPNDACRQLADDINSTRTLRGLAFITAGAAAAGAVVVYLMTPPEKPTQLRWLPAVDSAGVSLSLQGGF